MISLALKSQNSVWSRGGSPLLSSLHTRYVVAVDRAHQASHKFLSKLTVKHGVPVCCGLVKQVGIQHSQTDDMEDNSFPPFQSPEVEGGITHMEDNSFLRVLKLKVA